MQREKVFSIITIVCFASIIFIPIGLVLMCYFTDWKRKKKIIVGGIMTLVYVLPVLIVMNLKPGANTSGISLPGNYEQGTTEFENNSKGKQKIDPNAPVEFVEGKGNGEIENPEDLKNMELPSTIKKQARAKNTQWIFPLLFFLVMLFLIIVQNIRAGKKGPGYDNPYVDVKKYKLPLVDGFKFPMVHFLKLTPHSGENILYATETSQKDNEGNFVITDERVVIYDKKRTVGYRLGELTIVSSVSDNVMLLAAGEEKNYIFLPNGQMKYALAVVRFAYEKFTGKN